jgi:hypothetical protein
MQHHSSDARGRTGAPPQSAHGHGAHRAAEGGATNLPSGLSIEADLGGHATVTFRKEGSIEVYGMHGLIGMAWPEDDVYSRGFCLMNGYHVVVFVPALSHNAGRQGHGDQPLRPSPLTTLAGER